jgi:hypothetical protein
LRIALQRATGLGRHARRTATDQHATQPLLEQLDALADRRRRQVQPPRGGFEAAFVQNGFEGGELARVESHGRSLEIFMMVKRL